MKVNILTRPEDVSSFSDAVKRSRITIENKTFSLDNLSLKTCELKTFIFELNKREKLFEFDFSKTSNTVYKVYENESLTIEFFGNSKDLNFNVYADTHILLQSVWNVYKEVSKDDLGNIELFFNTFTIKYGNLYESSTLLAKEDINYISKLYYPYLKTDIMFDQFFTCDENILLLVGAPGLGKSKLSTMALKYAMENPDKIPYDKTVEEFGSDEQYITAVTCKSIDILTNDGFWRSIEVSKPDFVILDDLDNMLTSRDNEVVSQTDSQKNIFLNQFLSFTDGINKCRTKFIITTNKKFTEIDNAILRKGRLFDIIELRKLSYNEALDIWKENKLEESLFSELYNEDDSILSADLGSEISKCLNERISNAQESYILESGISRISEALREKTISL